MPEGHVVHRLAEAFQTWFAGQQLAASSPQGRFAEGAARLDGRRLLGAEAWGKQMFLRFDDELWLRVHLGMYGMWRFHGAGLEEIGRRTRAAADPAEEEDEDGAPARPAPLGAVRLRLATPTHLADLSGPSACILQDPAEKNTSTAEIGPDPLRPDADPAAAWAVINRSRTAIGQLLMRQDVVGGIGNIYRAELLFRAGIDPHRPGRELRREQWDALWRDAQDLMRDGVRQGLIITTRPEHRPKNKPTVGRAMRYDARSYAAFRAGEPCRVCSTPIKVEPMAGRKLYWCPSCQAG